MTGVGTEVEFPGDLASTAAAYFGAEDLADLSRAVRKRPVVLFFGRPSHAGDTGAFSDNSKYVYLRAAAASRGYDVVWCTADGKLAGTLRERGLPVHHLGADTDATVDLLLHAAVAVFTVHPHDTLYNSRELTACLAGATKIQLWHGVSVKQLVLQLLPHLGVQDGIRRAHWLSSTRCDYALSTASFFDDFWSRTFGTPNLLRAGQPRNAVLVADPAAEAYLGAELPAPVRAAIESDRPVVLLVPTWQRNKATALLEPKFLEETIQFAVRNDAHVIFKAHPSLGGLQSADSVDRLHVIDPSLDIYPWMSRISALVTDYSSIMFDFLLTGKPVLTLDLEPGEHEDFEPDYSLVPPGEFRIPFTVGDFAAKLERALGDDTGRAARTAYAEKIFETDPGAAPDDVLQLVDRLVEDATRPAYRVWSAR